MKKTQFTRQLCAWEERKGHKTLGKAAAALGVPYRTYQDWRLGNRQPRGIALKLIQDKISGSRA